MPTSHIAEEQYEYFLGAFARDRDRLFRYIFSLLPNHSDAEDVFQRCSLVMWRKFSEFDKERNFLSWACGIAFNEVRHYLRTSGQQKLKFDSDLLLQISDTRISNLDGSKSLLPHLAGCIKQLPSRDQELVRVAYGEKNTLKEFAQTTNLAVQTLYNKLSRIRRQLLDCVRRKLAVE